MFVSLVTDTWNEIYTPNERKQVEDTVSLQGNPSSQTELVDEENRGYNNISAGVSKDAGYARAGESLQSVWGSQPFSTWVPFLIVEIPHSSTGPNTW